MNLRHAAALALIGWYLMLPPFKNGAVDPNAPLSEWQIAERHDSIAPCQWQADHWPEQAKRFAQKLSTNQSPGEATNRMANTVVAEMAQHAQCIATDDPRLK